MGTAIASAAWNGGVLRSLVSVAGWMPGAKTVAPQLPVPPPAVAPTVAGKERMSLDGGTPGPSSSIASVSQSSGSQTTAPSNAQTVERAAEARALAALASRCAQGDAQAWAELARTQHRRVYGICFRFTNDAAEAEDQTQEVFLKLYRVIGSFDPAKASFGVWLTTLTRNLLVDNYRRSRDERVTDSLDEPAGAEEDGPTRLDRLRDERPSQESHVAGLELRASIQAALAKVAPELREAVILRDLEDMDYREIAEVLHVPVGTVKSRISRGRCELAKLLARREGQVV